MSSVFIVDDDRALCRSLEIRLKMKGLAMRSVYNVADAMAAVDTLLADLVIVDLNLPDGSGMEVLRAVLSKHPHMPVVMITGQQDMGATIEAMRAGAMDYLRKPFDFEDILLLLEKAKRFAGPGGSRENAGEIKAEPSGPGEIIGANRAIVEIIKQIGLLSRSRVNVLIEGETGTGKELVAGALHRAAAPGQPFVAVNCSAIVSTLFESELFGHEKGAFTGAVARKTGKLEFAGEGTVFLDEIGDLSMEMQAKLLRVIQEQRFERVGGLESLPFNARIVAATHRNLELMVKQGTFRQDLFFRIAVSRIQTPALRDHPEDIPDLVKYLMHKISGRLHRNVDSITEDAMRVLKNYSWPGNVRELENVLSRAVALAQSTVITPSDISFPVCVPESAAGRGLGQEILSLREAEKHYVGQVLELKDWNISASARALDISPTTLRKKIRDYGLKRDA